jgi:hypothetical protein
MRTFAQKPKATHQTTSGKSTISGRAHFGQGREVESMLHLQRTIGNQAVQQMVQPNAEELEVGLGRMGPPCFAQIPVRHKSPASVQAKLTVGPPGDIYEQEADRISEHVMRMPEPRLQRACACGGRCPTCQPAKREHERLQAKRVQASDAGHNAVPSIIHQVLSSPGQPLDAATRAFMEPRLGYDFSRVRVHSGPAAQQSVGDVNAHAYTVGRDIVFGAGRYAPGTYEGRRLLAHELTHVVQQSGADRIPVGQSNEKRGLPPSSAARFVVPGAPVVQRACGEKQIEDALRGARGVYIDLGDPGVAGTLVRFRVACDELLRPEDEATLRGLAGSLPWRTRIVIHGFASEEGSPTFNQLLSMARAEKARGILSGRLDPNQIERVVAHGGVPGNRADRRSVIIQTQGPLPKVTKTLTIVSWINGTGLPSFSRTGLAMAPGDLVAPLATCMALGCTANTRPPTSLPSSGLSAFIGSKQYRGVQNYTLTYIPSTSARGEFFSRQIVGYTAPSSCGPIPPSTFQLGEASPLNYATADMSGTDPSADALMNFRVSSAEESSAIEEATSFPGSLLFSRRMLRRVPWVWTQTHLRLDAGTGKLHWHVRGAAFPTHTIYLDGARVGEIPQGPCRVVVASHFRTANMPRQTMAEEARQASVPITKQEETVEPGASSSGAG